MDKKTYISVEEAAKKLAAAPLATVMAQRNEILLHMASLRQSPATISLEEYRKFYQAKVILDGVLLKRRQK